MAASGEVERLRARVADLEALVARLQAELAVARRAPGAAAVPATAAGASAGAAAAPAAIGTPLAAAAAGGGIAMRAQSGGNTAATSSGGSADDVQCHNCRRFVPAGTLVLHQAYCLRHIRLCPQCGAAVATRELDAHIATARSSPLALRAAVASGDLAPIREALAHGVVPDATWLPAAVTDTPAALRRDTVTALLSLGCNVSMATAEGLTPLHVAVTAAIAATRRCEQLDAGGASSEGDAKEEGLAATSSRVAAEQEEGTAVQVVRDLLAAGANVDARTPLGDTPLHMAQRGGCVAISGLLTAAGGSLRPVRAA